MRDLSCALSGLLHNPLLSAKLFDAIAGEVGEHAEDWESTEIIERSLKQMKAGEAE